MSRLGNSVLLKWEAKNDSKCVVVVVVAFCFKLGNRRYSNVDHMYSLYDICICLHMGFVFFDT